MTHAAQFRKLLIALLAAVMFTFAIVTVFAAADAGAAPDRYTQLRQQRDKQIRKCNLRVKKATKRVKKAKRQVKTARKRHNAKRVRKAKRTLKKAKRALKKAKRARPACVKKAKSQYRKKLGALAPEATGKSAFKARGSVGDAYVLGASQGHKLILVNGNEKQVAEGTADAYGSVVFYDVTPGSGYSVREVVSKTKVLGTAKFEVLAPDKNPPQSFYKGQTIRPGLNYITMRDGIELAVTMRVPPGQKPPGGWPTVLEISGYETASPHDLLNSVISGTPDPLAPSTSTAVGALIAPQAGFASLSVQMRGTGCSGGAFGLFDLPNTYDGYDMVEFAANQSWSSGRVGLAGISYSGISQLFVGGTNPPHLEGIAPLSVTPDLYTGTGYPGGIFNKGFALSWISDRVADAKPAPTGGQQWARIMSTTGDPNVTEPLRSEQKQHCLDNQKLRLQTRDVFKMIEDNPFRTPSVFNNRSPQQWLAKTKAPVFLAGAFQDEQTGGEFPNALAGLKNNPNAWFMLQNGVHVDALGPSVITDWGDFLNIFVADRVPKMPPLLMGMSSVLYGELADAPALPVRESAYSGYPTAAAAKAAYIANTPRLRLLMDNGAATVQGPSDPSPGTQVPGGIGALWKIGLDDWPVPQTQATDYYLGNGGALSKTKDGSASEVSYTADPQARPAQSLAGNDEGAAWKSQPPYDWTPVAAGKGLGFTTGALAADTLVAGPTSLDLTLKSSVINTDLQATISEVRPDGEETYIQTGWLRASHRFLDQAKSTPLMPVPTHLEQDAANLTPGQFTQVRVPIFPLAHMFRAGSKIRVTITATGGDRPRWDFQTIDSGNAVNTVQLGGAEASKLVLPVVPASAWQSKMEKIDPDGLGYSSIASVPALPGPTALRGEPSRTWEAASNGG